MDVDCDLVMSIPAISAESQHGELSMMFNTDPNRTEDELLSDIKKEPLTLQRVKMSILLETSSLRLQRYW
jgi:hypothetical protein